MKANLLRRTFQRLALLKARQALKGVADAVVLGADTSVVIDGDIFGKPTDADESRFGCLSV